MKKTTGEFSYKKIDKVIDLLKKEEVYENKLYIKSVIDVIGEPIIKRKLEEKYKEALLRSEENIAMVSREDYIKAMGIENNSNIMNKINKYFDEIEKIIETEELRNDKDK